MNKLLLHHLIEKACVLKFDLRAQARSLPRPKTSNMRINYCFTISIRLLPCSIRDCSFNSHFSLCSLWRLHSYPETIPPKELLFQFVRSSSCYLWSSCSYPETTLRNCSFNLHIHHCILFGAHALILRLFLEEFPI